MIVDHEKKFVFIHIPKTGGTSVTSLLGYPRRPPNPHRVEPGTPVDYADYLRFCFVRNPWDRLYSSYKYTQRMAARGVIKGDVVRELCRDHPDLTFEEFVLDHLNPDMIRVAIHYRPQMRWIAQSAPQFIGRMETFQSDVDFLLQALRQVQTELPHDNRSTTANYLEVYTPSMIDRVSTLYRGDIKALGYRFET